MAAPSATVWGSIVGGYGRIGIYSSVANTNTQTTVKVEVWFWSKYSVSDSGNTLYYDILATAGSATTSRGAVAISTSVASGSGWSTSNQQRIGSYTHTYARAKGPVTKYLRAKLINIDRVGGAMSAASYITVPQLPWYNITYDPNGGSGESWTQQKWYGEDAKITTTKPTRTGYTFLGWNTSASAAAASSTYAPGATYSTNAALTLYAIWKANIYSVKYNANGGTGAPAAQTKTYGKALTLSSTIPARTNYNFLGWGIASNATVSVYSPGGSYTQNAAITLYAVWELAYVKPRVNNLSITRCDADGTPNDSGTNALVSFDWACDKAISSITVDFESELGDAITGTISASGTSGTVSAVLGNSELSPETTYAITMVVTDTNGRSYIFGTLGGTKFTIDFMSGGLGAAFGKPAELDGVLDIGFQTRHFGGLLPVVLDPETDLNNIRTPNTYTGANVVSNNYVNCPVANGTFTLIVESGGEDGQVRQTYISCSKYKPERYVRFYYQSAWGDWFWAGTEECVLYENASGSNGTITLSASIANYRYLEIYFTDNNGKSGGYTKVWSPNGKTICLNIVETSSATSVIFRQTMYTLSSTTMTPKTDVAGYLQFNPSTKVIANSPVGTNYIKIVRVIGRA